MQQHAQMKEHTSNLNLEQTRGENSPSQLLLCQHMNNLLQFVVIHICVGGIVRRLVLIEAEAKLHHCWYYECFCGGRREEGKILRGLLF